MKFHDEDELGLEGIPYYGLKLTPEEAKAVEGKIAGIYEIDGRQMFECRDENHQSTGKILYIVWIDKKS